MVCPVPTAIANGYYVGAKVSYSTGDVVQYVCNTEYVMSGSPVSTCNASGYWIPTSGSLPECNTSYFTNVWFLLVVSLMGFIALVILLVLIGLCCRLLCKTRIYDEESDSDGGRCCRPWCASCTCCWSAEKDGRPSRSVKRKPLTTTRKAPVKKVKTKKAVTKKTARKATQKTLVSKTKRGNLFKGKNSGKNVKKGKSNPSKTAENKSSNSRKAKKVAAWKPFANPIRNINTSTK